MIPDWLSNIHPLIIHFPIALLVVAVLFEIGRLFFKNNDWMTKTILSLYAIGTTGLLAAFWSGRRAVEAVTVSGDAVPVVTTHEDWALYTLIFYTIFTIARFLVWWKEKDKFTIQLVVIISAIVGTGMLWYTGELGAKLVYKHGVAVGEVDRLNQHIEILEQRLAEFRVEAGPEFQDDGSWIWRFGVGSDELLSQSFNIVGDNNFQSEIAREVDRTHLELVAPEGAVFFYTGGNLRTIDGRVEVNLTDFTGSFKLIHHFTDTNNYQYIRINNSELQQGQIINGEDSVLGSGQVESDGWHVFRVTASGRHFYGYQNDRTIVHTHADELVEGKTGFSIYGNGTIKIRVLEFKSL